MVVRYTSEDAKDIAAFMETIEVSPSGQVVHKKTQSELDLESAMRELDEGFPTEIPESMRTF